MNYRIDLLGGLRVTRISTQPSGDDTPITRFRTRKTAMLLAYLALYPNQHHAREALIELFWPDLELAAARDNLSGVLSSIRRQWNGTPSTKGTVATPSLLLANRDAVWLNTSAAEVDVAMFERALDASSNRQTTPVARRETLESAAQLYRGPLLPEVYEEWAIKEQTRLAQRHVLGLAALADAQEETGSRDLALSTARRAQQSDPFFEAPYQTEMRLLVSGGQKDAAERVYKDFATYLNSELGCRPSPKMQTFLQRLDTIEPEERVSVLKAPVPTDLSLPSVSASAAGIPVPFSRFWGRENEVEQLVEMLNGENGPRLITITGPGGIGKTHLSLVAAARLAAIDSQRRLCWVPLADASDERLFLSAVQQALGGFEGNAASDGDPIEHLASRLTPTATESGVVVLLDNLEQLVGSSDGVLGRVPALIRLLLMRVPGLVFLGTSRRILGLGGEQEFPISSLPVPQPYERRAMQAATQVLGAFHAIPSVALFVERARLVRPDFTLTVANAETVAAICCRLEGVPLALEMAASWVRTLSLHQIREQLDKQVSVLQSRRRDLPPRHRSLRATVEWSWELLPRDIRHFFLNLCVFRGGFTAEAAAALGDEGSNTTRTVDWLGHLQEHSLLVRRATEPSNADAFDASDMERFSFLEPVREWGLEKLGEDNAAFDATRRRHAHYYKELAGIKGASLKHEEQNCIAALNELLRSQPDPKVEATTIREGLRMALRLANFWCERGLYALGYPFLTSALARYREVVVGKNGIEEPELFAEALHDAGGTARYLNRLDEAESWIGQAQAHYIASGNKQKAARCEGDRGTIAIERRDYEAAAQHYERATTLGREINDRRLIGLGLLHIGALRHELGDLKAARANYTEAMEIFQAEKDWFRCVCLLLNQGTLSLQEGAPEAAQKFIEDGLDKAAELDNPRLTSHLLATAAAVAARTGQAARATRLFASADQIIEESGAPLLPSEKEDRALATGGDAWRGKLSIEEEAHAQGLGRADSLEEAVAYARQHNHIIALFPDMRS